MCYYRIFENCDILFCLKFADKILAFEKLISDFQNKSPSSHILKRAKNRSSRMNLSSDSRKTTFISENEQKSHCVSELNVFSYRMLNSILSVITPFRALTIKP